MQVTYLQRTVGGLDPMYGVVENLELWVDANRPIINGVLTLYTRQGADETPIRSAQYKMQMWDGDRYEADRVQLVGGLHTYFVAVVDTATPHLF